MRIRTISPRIVDCDVGVAIFGGSGHALASRGNEPPALPQEPGCSLDVEAAARARSPWEGVDAPAPQLAEGEAALLQ